MTEHQVRQPKADIGRQQIGSVYAKAFLATAGKTNTVDDDLDEFAALLADVVDQQPVFEATLASPRVSAEEKIDLLDKTLQGHASDGLLTFVKVVCQHGRLDCLREIYLAARRQHNHSKGVMQVHVTTAEALDENMSGRIQKDLSEHLQHDVELVKHVNPSILGGMIVRIGDMVYDSSVRQKLNSIRQQTVENTAQQMRDAIDRFALSN